MKTIKQPIIQPTSKGRYKLAETYWLVMGEDTITIPKGFQFDGNSTLISRFDPAYVAAALVHDYLYRIPKFDSGKKITREQADIIYYKILQDLKVWKFVRGMFFVGVRLFGGSAWRKYRISQKA